MFDSGLKVYTDEHSWVWWQYMAYKKGRIKWLDEKLIKIEKRIDYIPKKNFGDQVGFTKFLDIANGKAIMVTALDMATDLTFVFANLKWKIGANKYFYDYFGWPIQKKSKYKRTLIKM